MSAFTESLIELLVKGIPEGLLDVYLLFLFTKTPFNKKRYFQISCIIIIAVYIIRWLPITYGINTMLNLLVLIIAFASITKADLPKVIISVIGIAIILFITEELNILFLALVYGMERTAELLTSTLGKTIYGIPSTVFFLCFVFIISKILKKRREKES